MHLHIFTTELLCGSSISYLAVYLVDVDHHIKNYLDTNLLYIPNVSMDIHEPN